MIQEKSNGKLWICLDPKDLNTAIIDDLHPIPTLDDITHKLNGSTLYGKLDCTFRLLECKIKKKNSMHIRLLECKINKKKIYVNNI